MKYGGLVEVRGKDGPFNTTLNSLKGITIPKFPKIVSYIMKLA